MEPAQKNGCRQCGNEEARVKRRGFSQDAQKALVAWGEVEADVVDSPICDDCYGELRDVLIERADEVGKNGPPPRRKAKAA